MEVTTEIDKKNDGEASGGEEMNKLIRDKQQLEEEKKEQELKNIRLAKEKLEQEKREVKLLKEKEKIEDEMKEVKSDREKLIIDNTERTDYKRSSKESMDQFIQRRLDILRKGPFYEEEVKKIDNEKKKVEDEIEQNEEAINEINKTMPLRERVKDIIKKHGLTVTGIALCVGTIIGVIVSNLSSGLSAVAKATANALKGLGKKLAAILPGMIGAIASYIFKTAGEVVGFLGKHAWVLIVGVVVLMVSQLKKKLKSN